MDKRENPREFNEVTPVQPAVPIEQYLDLPGTSQKVMATKVVGADFESVDFKKFFSVTGPGVLYCLSAASIMYAIMKLVGPGLENSFVLKETLPSVFVLGVYEIALLGVLSVIVIKARAVNDAIVLVVLMAFFTVGTGVALTIVSLTAQKLCLFIGINFVLIGAAKLWVLKKYIGMKIGWVTFAGFVLVLVWNFAVPSWSARVYVNNDCSDEVRRFQWMLSWMVLLGGCLVIIIDSMRKNVEEYAEDNKGKPFLKTHSMVRVYAMLMVAAGCFHQYAAGYMFNVYTGLGDYVIFAAVMSVMIVELIRSTGRKPKSSELVILCMPIAAVFYAIADKQFVTFKYSDSYIELMTHPAVIMTVMAVMCGVMGYVNRYVRFYYVGVVYGLGVLLTIGYSQSSPDLNWELFGAGLFVVMMAIGIVRKEPAACFAAVLIFAAGLAMSGRLDDWARVCHVSELALLGSIAGVGSIFVGLVFGRKTHFVILIFGTMCMAIACWDVIGKEVSIKDIVVLVILIAAAVGIWIRTRNVAAVCILFVPMLPKVYFMWKETSTWAFVVLSFVLLFAGAGISVLVNRDKD